MLRPHDKIDRYTIEGTLGQGGMGLVYRAFDSKLHRHVALKVLHQAPAPGDSDTPSDQVRLMREARAAAALSHPNVVAIYDVGEAHGTSFIAMELIEGRSLRSHVGDASIPIETRARWLTDVARALSAAHERGLVHRDIKPENVMIRSDGAVKVLDFGIARRDPTQSESFSEAAAVATVPTLTREGAIVGTPLYMAPEQLRQEALDARADQFSWGVMSYELMAGSHPFGRITDAMQLAAHISSAEAPPLDTRVAEAPPLLCRAIERAMRKNKDERYPSMRELLADLDSVATPRAPSGRSPLAITSDLALANTQLSPDIPLLKPTSIPPTVRDPSPKRWIALSALVVGIPLLIYALPRWMRGGGGGTAPSTSASVYVAPSASSAPASPAASSGLAAVTDAPASPTKSAEALDDYRLGLQSFRDGKWRETVRIFEKAAVADPTFASAQLRVATLSLLYGSLGEMTARRLHEALGHRAFLSHHDQVLLDALEPATREPSDSKESARRLELALNDAPGDVEYAFFLGVERGEMGEYAAAEAALDAALARDPQFAAALNWKGRLQRLEGRYSEAAASWDRCVTISSTATACLRSREDWLESDGQCRRAEQDLRQLISLEPEEQAWRWRLAKVLYALGGAPEAVSEALRQRDERVKVKAPRLSYAYVELDVLAGDFASAESRLAEVGKALATTSTDEDEHATLLESRLLLAEEMGENAKAATWADAYLKARAAWTPPSDALSLEPESWDALLRAGKLDTTEYAKRRDEWEKRDREIQRTRGLPKEHLFYAWLKSRGWGARTAEEAKAALALMPSSPPPIWDADWSLVLGRTFAMGGRLDDGIDILRRISRSCSALDDAVSHTRASDALGQALEEKHDVQGACAAYSTVISRWGKAKPRSVTADHARARSKALGCKG